MVMHARKLPRLSDGYFDRNQAHPFENAGKFSKPTDRTNEKIRGSPITSNSDVSSRNDILDNRSSPRYHRPCSQRLKDKDHHEDSSSSKSPIVKNESKGSTNKDCHRLQSSFDREELSERYQSNHDRSASEENERKPQLSDWSEHISSSGKKYYYNCKTEISQWEKPKELIEYERQQNLSRLSYDTSRPKERSYDRLNTTGGTKNAHSQDSVEENSESGSHLLSPSQVTLSNLPKLISQLAGTKGLPNLSELSPQEALRTIQQALQLTKQVTNLSQTTDQPSASPAGSPASSTHSTDSPSVLTALPAPTLKPSIPSLTPSLANYYREDLIGHVTGWQADHAERQANRYWEEGHSISCTQVSAELKMARALVRLAEIQATLQEQRILFLRQQTKELEDWRSLNSFMGDS